MRQIKLLVALSLLFEPKAPAASDQHKQPSAQMRGKGRKFLAFAYASGRLTSEGGKPIPGITIAADPHVLPMGSRVRVTGAGAYSGVYTVSDRGSKIKGRAVDIFMRSHAEARQFGRKQVYVTVLGGPEKTVRARRKPGVTMASCPECERKQPTATETRSRNHGGDSSFTNVSASGSAMEGMPLN